ncbi:ASA1 [Candida oxycetoniae]|uniref:ASA1 n=1 Tax=Candida oxycetoniae TaxID=497107 RepID=A0AAI9SXL7_9ASCO|nr:ASA1 [Candida oxycetoniae]KAI3404973.2 ASA1 [Candida oxycetoniae]
MRQFALRSHSAPITYILPVLSSSLTRFVYTADQQGYVIKWNLQVKRPDLQWQAHTDSILTILEWDQYIITHSRDSTIRIWLDDEKCYEVPVNALNFSNIVMFNNRYLITPATLDSNNMDVYELTKDPIAITRVLANFGAYKLVNTTGLHYRAKRDSEATSTTDDDADVNVKGRKDFGIIMKMLLINKTVYIGFESGDIIGLIMEFSETLGARFTLAYHNTTHCPNPVISLANVEDTLISGSTSNKLVYHHKPVKIVPYPQSGIQAIIPYNDDLIIGFWDGSIEYKGQIIQRDLPHLRADDDDNTKTVLKLTFMSLLPVTTSKSENQLARGKYAMMIKKSIETDLLLAGYEDGTILAFSIT